MFFPFISIDLVPGWPQPTCCRSYVWRAHRWPSPRPETHRTTPRPWKIRERRGKYVAVRSERVVKTHTDDTFLAFLRSLGKQVVGSKYFRTNTLTALNTTNKHWHLHCKNGLTWPVTKIGLRIQAVGYHHIQDGHIFFIDGVQAADKQRSVWSFQPLNILYESFWIMPFK